MSERQVLRRVAGALCLLLAFYCLVAAAATLSARPVSASPEVGRQAERATERLPLLIPVVFFVFLVVVTAVIHRQRQRPSQSIPPEARLR